MTAARTLTDETLDLLRADVRTGRSCVATFDGPTGTSWVEILGPNGSHGDPECLVAPVRTLRLWVPERPEAPAAVAVITRDFEASLRAIEERARPHLYPPEAELLATVLREVRAAAPARRARVPMVGNRLTEEGTPSLRAWLSPRSAAGARVHPVRRCLMHDVESARVPRGQLSLFSRPTVAEVLVRHGQRLHTVQRPFYDGHLSVEPRPDLTLQPAAEAELDFLAATPIFPCFPNSSISFLTCASVVSTANSIRP